VTLYVLKAAIMKVTLFLVKLSGLKTVRRCRGSSVSTVSDYRLYDQVIEVLSPAGAKDFSSILYVQTGSGAHPASSLLYNGYRGSFTRG
jgi:hypothetical protein